MASEIRFERLAAGQHAVYRDLRLTALKDSPQAFATTYREALTRSEESWKTQADALAQASDRAAFLAFNGGLAVGLMAFYGNDATRGEVMQVWVSPRTRGKGVALRLLERLLQWARAQGYLEADVRAKAGNARALGFYEKAGFHRAETVGDEIRLEKTLN